MRRFRSKHRRKVDAIVLRQNIENLEYELGIVERPDYGSVLRAIHHDERVAHRDLSREERSRLRSQYRRPSQAIVDIYLANPYVPPTDLPPQADPLSIEAQRNRPHS